MKGKILILLMAVACMLLLFTQCEKDHTSTVKVSCYYINEDNDTLGPIAGVWVEADTSRLSPHITMDTVVTVSGDTLAIQRTNFCSDAICKAKGYTGSNGTITFTFPQPLLLTFNAVDTLKDVAGNDSLIYKGKAEVLIKDGAEVECPIYLSPYSK